MTLKQRQGHQTWYELVDIKLDCNHAKFEGPPLRKSTKKPTLKFFFRLLSSQETHQLSPVIIYESQK